MKHITHEMLSRVMFDAAPRRTPVTISARIESQPVTERTAHDIYGTARGIWDELLARGDTIPSGNDYQCLVMLNRYANQVRGRGLHIPDFLFMSTSEYADDRQQSQKPPIGSRPEE